MSNTFPTLYSLDSKGKVRQWSVHTEGNKIVVTHGLRSGKMQEVVTYCAAKNVGKSNETTPEQQAQLEAESKFVYQIEREDYALVPEDSGKQTRPMLALDYTKVPHRVRWNDVMVQPKLDGLRLVAGRRWAWEDQHEMMTRKGEVYSVPHLVDATKELLAIVNKMCNNRCIALDGEAYIHGMPLQQITSLARKYQKGKTEKLRYYMFDLVIPGMAFMQRYSILSNAFDAYNKLHGYGPGNDGPFALVITHRVTSEDEMKAYHGMWTEAGFEGVMIRHCNSEYEIGQRSANLFKYKQFFDTEAKIINVWEDKNGNAMLTVRLKNGLECGVTPKRTHEVRKQMLAEKDELIGKWITVKYQAETDDGNLQFPVGLDLRECDDNGEPIV